MVSRRAIGVAAVDFVKYVVGLERREEVGLLDDRTAQAYVLDFQRDVRNTLNLAECSSTRARSVASLPRRIHLAAPRSTGAGEGWRRTFFRKRSAKWLSADKVSLFTLSFLSHRLDAKASAAGARLTEPCFIGPSAVRGARSWKP
jgi:hypothetical protein